MNQYNTIGTVFESEALKIKNSKFIGCAVPVSNEKEVKLALNQIKQKHSSASHCCYAYRIGTDSMSTRVNDDGEPTNSAGKPILGQILAFNLTNILVVIIRYYGGKKLGVGGLIAAYRDSTKLTLNGSELMVKERITLIELKFKYHLLNTVMRIAKQYQLSMTNQVMELDCTVEFKVPHKVLLEVVQKYKTVYGLKINKS